MTIQDLKPSQHMAALPLYPLCVGTTNLPGQALGWTAEKHCRPVVWNNNSTGKECVSGSTASELCSLTPQQHRNRGHVNKYSIGGYAVTTQLVQVAQKAQVYLHAEDCCMQLLHLL